MVVVKNRYAAADHGAPARHAQHKAGAQLTPEAAVEIPYYAPCTNCTAQQHTGSNNKAASAAIEVVFITMMIDSLIWI